MRLIDGDALQKEFEYLAANQWNKETHTTCARVFKESAERVEDAKTVDAVEVVRCKDCRWWDKKDGANYGYCHAAKHGYFSKHWEISIYRTYQPDFYCADGERRNE